MKSRGQCTLLILLAVVVASCLQLAEAFSPSISSIKPQISYSVSAKFTTSLDVRTLNKHCARWGLRSKSDDEEEEDPEDVKKRVREEIFWAKQRALAAEMSAKSDATSKREQQEKYEKRALALTSDTLYFSILIASLLWFLFPNPFVSISYLFGALSGTAYSYGLGKYVQTIGGTIDDVEIEGAGIGQARFAFLILLFVAVGKFRDQGLLEIPSIMGFFTYQLASLGQGLREIDD